jgi:hypothetical protein
MSRPCVINIIPREHPENINGIISKAYASISFNSALLWGATIGKKLAVLRQRKEVIANIPMLKLASFSGDFNFREKTLTKTPDIPKPMRTTVTVR